MKLTSLSLRGAVGIERGLGVDDLVIDFTTFEPGLIALVAPNGSGKTTILENLHPYRGLVSRTGALQNHFFGRDSHRILRFAMGGYEYCCKLLIDAQTGKQESYLYRDNEPLNDGKTTTYDAVVAELFGSEDMFFRSLFRAQGAESVAELKASERKKLFVELLGLERLQDYHEAAKERARGLELQIEKQRSAIAVHRERAEIIENSESELHECTTMLAEANVELEEAKRELDTSQQAVIGYELQLKSFEGKRKLREQFTTDRDILHHEVGKLLNERLGIEREIERKRKVIENKDVIEAKVQKIASLRSEIETYTVQRERYNELRHEETMIHAAIREAESRKRERASKIASLEKQVATLEESSALIETVPCSGLHELQSSCALLSNAYTNRTVRLPAMLDELAALQQPNGEAHDEDYTTKLDSIQRGIETLAYNASLHEQAKNELSGLEREKWEALLAEANTAQALLTQLEIRRAGADTLLTQMRSRIDELESEIHRLDGELKETTEITENLEREKTSVQLLVPEIRTIESRIEQLKQRSSVLAANIDDARKANEQAEKLEKEIAGTVLECEEWHLLARATGKDGIQALELDAAGPNVSAIANQLLSDTFGSQFQITFETTRASADKKKQIETFEIKVLADGREQTIENLSGGQKVWIEAALSQAIGIYLRRKSGLDLRTNFLDEADGALDVDNAYKYLQMLRASHELSGTYYTILITHRQELLALVPQQIRLVPGEGVRYVC